MMIPNENERLRMLLREAAAWLIADPKTNPGYYAKVMELRERIHAELARPPDPPMVDVEWVPDTFWGDGALEARAQGFYLSVHLIPFEDDGSWDWDVSRSEVAESGSAPTKEAAIAAAIKAVRARL
jgi:hypothetical protein